MDFNKPTILVVDDEPNLRSILNCAISHNGDRVIEAQNGEACLLICQQQLPDLILIDAVMPDMDGFACCQRLKATYGSSCPPLIMITALSNAEFIDRAFNAGITDYITKPIRWPILRHRIDTALEKKKLQQQLDEAHRRIEYLEQELAHQELLTRSITP
ncbi:MAG: hypothetical protein B0A82_05255 [Alkalinema sp. CACIAM 70d]|nr:MAG: hypothetical protein B0A82_05255 [Alkalinema sp. CACIAM 70d]